MKKVFTVIMAMIVIICGTFLALGIKDKYKADTVSPAQLHVISADNLKRLDKGICFNVKESSFVSINGDKTEKLQAQEVETEVTYDSVSRKVKYQYTEVNDKFYIHQVFEGEDNERMVFQIGDTGMGTMLFYCTEGTAHGFEKIYPLKFDIETGEVEDIFADTEIDGIKLFEYSTIKNISIGRNKIIATIGKDGTEDTVIIDGNTLEAVKLQDVLPIQAGDFYESTDDSVIVDKDKEVWKYNFDTKESIKLCENAERLDAEFDGIYEDSTDTKYALVHVKDEIYILDYESQDMKKAEGVKWCEEFSNCEINNESKKAVMSGCVDDAVQVKIINLVTGSVWDWNIDKENEAYSDTFIHAVWGNEENLILEYYGKDGGNGDLYRVIDFNNN